MSAVVVDTHTIVWYLAQDVRLSQRANNTLDAATQDGHPIYVPAICLIELTYLIEKGRLPPCARDRLIDAIDDPERPARLAQSIVLWWTHWPMLAVIRYPTCPIVLWLRPRWHWGCL